MSVIGTIWAELRLRAEQFQRDMQSAQSRITDAGRSMEQTGARLSSVGGSLTRTVTVPILGIGAAAGKTAMDFETSMSRIIGLVGLSRDEVKELEKAVLGLAPAVGKSPKELAEALFFITSAGIREPAAAMEVLTASAKASAAGLGETKDIALASGAAMNAYGSENLSATRAVDILVSTAREGNFETSELAGSIGRVIPLASEMGVGFEQVGGAIAGMTRLGLNANESITATRSLLAGIQKPTTAGKEALAGVGLSYGDLRKVIQQPGGILKALMLLKERFADSDEGLEAVIPNIRALTGAMALSGQNADAAQTAFENVAGSVGIGEEAFDAAAGTARHGFNQAMAQAQVTLARLGKEVLPPLMPAIKAFGKAVEIAGRIFGALPGPVKLGIVAFFGLLAAVGPVLLILGQLIMTAGFAVQGLAALGGPAGAAAKVSRAMGVLRLAVMGLGKAFLGLLANPIFLALAGLALLAFLIIKNWDTLKRWFGAFFAWLGPVFGAVWDGIKAAAGAVADVITKVWGGVRDFFTGLWDRLKKLFSRWGPVILALIAPMIGIPLLIFKNWDKIRDFMSGLWDRVKAIIQGGIEAVKKILGFTPLGLIIKNWDKIREVFTRTIERIRDIIARVWEWIVGRFEWVRGRVQTIFDGIQRIWDGWLRALGWVRDRIAGVIDRVRGIFQGLVDFFRRVIDGIRNAIERGIGFFHRLRDNVKKAIDKIKEIIDKILAPIKKTIDGIGKAIEKVAFWRKSPSELEVHATVSTENVLATFASLRKRMQKIAGQMRVDGMFDTGRLATVSAPAGGAAGAGGFQLDGPLLQITGPITIRSDEDIDRLSRRLAKDVTDAMRARGRTVRRDQRGR